MFSYTPSNFPRYDIATASFVNMPTGERPGGGEGGGGGEDSFPLIPSSSPTFAASPPSLSTSSSYSTASSSAYPVTPTQGYIQPGPATVVSSSQGPQWNGGGGGGVFNGGLGGHFPPPPSPSLPNTSFSSPVKPPPQNYERAPSYPPLQTQPQAYQPWNRQIASLPPQSFTLQRERPPISPELLKHRSAVQNELASHPSKQVPSVVPRTEKIIRFVYTLDAQLPPPLGLKIEEVSASKKLPLLPPLEEPLFSMVFTHTSWSSSSKKAFADPDGDALYDYERLEHLGDALLNVISTELIQDLFPRVTPGGASVLRANLVNNKHALSALATSYHLHTQLRASPSQVLSLKLQPNVRSQLFEAYLGAVSEHYSFQFARAWLREVLTPIAQACYSAFKAKADEDAKPKPGDADHQGYTAMLIEWSKINGMRVESIENEITYNHKNQKIYSFCLRVERKSFGDGDGGGDPEWLSFGPKQASQKKIAKNNVSYAACCFLGITRPANTNDPTSSSSFYDPNADVVAL